MHASYGFYDIFIAHVSIGTHHFLPVVVPIVENSSRCKVSVNCYAHIPESVLVIDTHTFYFNNAIQNNYKKSSASLPILN